MMVHKGKLSACGAHQRWSCPVCNRTLGEVYGDRVVIKAGDRYITFPREAPVTQTCPKCAADSTVRPDAKVA